MKNFFSGINKTITVILLVAIGLGSIAFIVCGCIDIICGLSDMIENGIDYGRVAYGVVEMAILAPALLATYPKVRRLAFEDIEDGDD